MWDNANRSHPVLLGEYATIQPNMANPSDPVDWSGAEPRLPYPIWVGAVGEAIYTLGAERNGDIVIGASYAPGFQNLNDFQWAVSSNLPLTSANVKNIANPIIA